MLDVVIKNGEIIDPVAGRFAGNVGIKDGKIVEVGTGDLTGKKVVDVEGKMISPGFIDIHMHEDKLEDNRIILEIFNYMACMGVTTAVGGNCGLGKARIDKYLKAFAQQGAPVNYLGLLGHASLREDVGRGDRYSPASREEIKEMGEMIKRGLAGDAAGLSFGLEYIPGTSTEEMLELCRAAAEFPGKLVAAHYRFDANRSLEAMGEMIIIARETGVKFQISHIGSCIAFGQMEPGLQMLTAAHKAGVDLMADVYPYDAFCTYVGSAIFDPGCFENWGVGYDSLQVAQGKYRGQRCDKEIFEYIRENEPDDLVIAFVMDEEEVVQAMQHDLVMIGSDGLMNDGQGHPRSTGTFPRVLGKYVRRVGELELVEAINKMTYMPAKRLGLDDKKGRIKEGYDADIIVFDYNSIIDKSTFKEPALAPEGIINVLVAGEEVVVDGKLTGNYPGKVIKF